MGKIIIPVIFYGEPTCETPNGRSTTVYVYAENGRAQADLICQNNGYTDSSWDDQPLFGCNP